MKTRFLAWLCVLCAVVMTALAGCDSDEGSPGNAAGNGGTGNAAGTAGNGGTGVTDGGDAQAGNGGTADDSGTDAQAGNGGSNPDGGDEDTALDGAAGQDADQQDAEAGTQANPWKKGKKSVVTSTTTISANGGPVLAVDIKDTQQQTMSLQGTFPQGKWTHYPPGAFARREALRQWAGFAGLGAGHEQQLMDLPLDGGDSDADMDADLDSGTDAEMDAADELTDDAADEADLDAAEEADGTDQDAGTVLPPTIPTVDFSEATPTSVLVMEVPPYLDPVTQLPAYPPYTVYIHPDTSMDVLEHYQDWNQTLAVQCYGTFPVTVNGLNLSSYGGIVWDVVAGQNRNFAITSAKSEVIELLPNGTPKTLATDIVCPSSLLYDPMGKGLLVTTPPLYTKNLPGLPAQGVQLYRVTVDNPTKTLVATLPVPNDYTPSESVMPVCYMYPGTTYAVPNVLRIPTAVFSDGHYLVADVGAKRLYKVKQDGSSVTEYAVLPSMLVAALVVAPNDVVYMVTAPLLGDKNDGNGPFVIKGVTVSYYDETAKTWNEMVSLTGYEPYANNMSWGQNAVPCPPEFQDAGLAYCLQPLGVYLKVVPGQTLTTPFLLIADPITYRLFQLKLELSEVDAGTEDAAADAEPDASDDASID